MTHPELLTRSQAMELLNIRHPDTLARMRRREPSIATVVPGMRQYRYVRARLIALRAVGVVVMAKPESARASARRAATA